MKYKKFEDDIFRVKKLEVYCGKMRIFVGNIRHLVSSSLSTQ